VSSVLTVSAISHIPSQLYHYLKKEPKLIELNDVSISKITSSQSYNLLLSTDGDIYEFVDNSYGQIENRNKEYQSKSVRISHKN
jgi:alpha-tubulin suppressor-like RCC1 family protein